MTREKSIEIATKAHAGQKRKGSGEDYISHPLTVADFATHTFWQKFSDDYSDKEALELADKIYIVGVLHDVVEDTSITLGEIGRDFDDPDIIQALSMLTRREGQTYYDFIQNIALYGDLISLLVKISDIEHNMSDLKEGTLKDKYRFALKILQDALFSYTVLS